MLGPVPAHLLNLINLIAAKTWQPSRHVASYESFGHEAIEAMLSWRSEDFFFEKKGESFEVKLPNH